METQELKLLITEARLGGQRYIASIYRENPRIITDKIGAEYRAAYQNLVNGLEQFDLDRTQAETIAKAIVDAK